MQFRCAYINKNISILSSISFSGSLLTYLFPDSNGIRQVFAVDLPKPLSAEHSSSSEQSDVIIGESNRAFVLISSFFDPHINLFYFSITFLFTAFCGKKMSQIEM